MQSEHDHWRLHERPPQLRLLLWLTVDVFKDGVFLVVVEAGLFHVRVVAFALDLGRDLDALWVEQLLVVLLVLGLELPLAVEVAGLPHEGDLVERLPQVRLGLVDAGLEVAQPPDAVLSEHLQQLVDEHVLLHARRPRLLLCLSPSLCILRGEIGGLAICGEMEE